MGLKDWLIRKIATSFLLKWADGRKTEIMRLVQAINMLLAALWLWAPELPIVQQLNGWWLMLGVWLSHLGLEFGIQDGRAKEKLASTNGNT